MIRFIFLSMIFLLYPSALHAADLETCVDIITRDDIVNINFLMNTPGEHTEINKEFQDSFEMTMRQDQIIEDLSSLKVNTDGSVHLKNKKLQFTKGKPPKSDKKNPQPKKAFIARWTFNLDQAEEITINESRAQQYYFYKYLSLNGERLKRDKHNQWYKAQSGSISVLGKKGKNVLVAVCGTQNNNSPDNLRIFVGNLKKLVGTLARPSRDSKLSDEARAKPLITLGEAYSKSNGLVDGEILANIFIHYYRAYPKQNSEKLEKKRKYIITRFNSYWFGRCLVSDRWRYYKKIKDALPKWVHQSMFLSINSFNARNFQYLADSASRNASISYFNSYVKPIYELTQVKGENSKKIKDLMRRSTSQIMQALQEKGFFQQSLDLLEFAAGTEKIANTKRFREAAEQRLQTGAQLAGNPEAQQYYAELQTYLSRGSDDERAIDSMVSIFRKAGNKLLIEGLGMRSLNTEMLNEIQKDTSFYQKVVARAQGQFLKRSQKALDKGKLSIMSELIATYALLVDTESLHSALLNEYLDRCAYNRARHHALHLLKSKNSETAKLAAVKLLLIENILNLSSIERSNIPSSLLDMTYSIGGNTKSIRELQKSFGASNTSTKELQEPGPVIAYMAHGIPHGADLNGTPDLRTHAPQFSRQTVEPLYTQGTVICSTPSYIRSLNLSSKKCAWSIDQGPASIVNNKGYASKQHHAELINGNIALLWSHPDSNSYTIRAYNSDGILQWDMQDSPDSLRWTPICTPHSAFGMLFTIVYDNTIPNQYQVFLAILDGSNGHIEKTIALNTVFATPTFERGLSGIHFTHTEDALLGVSGSGVMFKLNRKALTLDWAKGLIYRRYHAFNTPAAFIKVYKDANVTIAHMPSMQEWAAVSTRSGRSLWRNVNPDIHFIHSRNNNEFLICSGRDSVISSIDIKTGATKWRTRANGFRITGEGTVCNNIIYVPCQTGFMRYKIEDGSFINFTKIPQTINKIRVDTHAWYFLTAENIYVCKHGGKFNATLFNAPAQILTEKIDPQHTALKTLNNLAPHFTIPEIGDERYTLQATKLDIPHYFLLSKYGTGNKALLREGFYDKNNIFHPDKIVWVDNALKLNIVKDKIIQYKNTSITVEGLPNKNPLIHAELSDYNINSQSIAGATTKDNTLIIVGDTSRKHKTVTHVDMTTNTVIKRFNFDAADMVYIDEDILICKVANNEILCLDTETCAEKWREKIAKGITYQYSCKLIDTDTLIYGFRGKSKLINKSTGKAISTGVINADPTRPNVICNNVLFSGNSVVNLKDGEKHKNVHRVYIDPNAGAAIYYKDQSMKWFGKNKTIDLENPKSHWSLDRSKSNNAAHVKGNILFIQIQNAVFAYNLTTGKKTQREYYSHDSSVSAILDNSIITASGPLAFILRPRTPASAGIDLCTVSQRNKEGWPTHGWNKPKRISANHWQASHAMKSHHKYAMQCGQDGKNHYIRLFCSPRKNANTERILNVTLALGNETEKQFQITWNIDRTPEATINLTQIGKLKSWRKIDKKGNVHCFIILNTDGIDTDHRVAERYCVNVTEYQSGKKEGTYLFGGVANLRLHKIFGKLASQHIRLVQNDDNFIYRKNTYDSNSSIIAQGKDLAHWVCTYKAINGHKNTIAYLKNMCKRCHASAIASNILAILLNEECKQWQDKNPRILTVSDQYRNTRLKIMKDLKIFAKSVGVSEEASELGLSIFAIETFPIKTKSFHISGFRSNGSQKERTVISQGVRAKSPFASSRISAPHVNALYFGAFDVTPATVSKKLTIWEIDAAIGRIEFFSPSRHILLIDNDGSTKNGCTAILNHQNKKDNIRQIIYTDGEHRYKAMHYDTRGRSKDITYDEIKLAKISTEKFSKKDLLTALNNLPSDSSLGDDIIAKIASKDPVEVEGFWKIILRQIGGTDYSNCMQAISNINKLSLDKTKSRTRTNTYLKELMRANKIPKPFQQKAFNNYNNSFVGGGRWYNLGVFNKIKGQHITPTPESVAFEEILKQKFTFNDKTYAFETSSSKIKKGDWNIPYRIENARSREPAISYHYSTFDLRDDKKIYFYLTQANTARYGCKFTLWIDGNEISSQIIGHSSRFPIAIPHRMKRGQHKILIGLDFQRGWDLRFHIGDAFGMPLDIVELPPTLPIK